MGLFNRRKNDDDDSSSAENKKEKGAWRRPANTAFKQQRLKAWQPILTPKTVLPTLFIIGIVFAPIGGLLIWGSSLVSEMTFDYSECEHLTPSPSNGSLSFSDMPSNKFFYNLRSADKNTQPATPRYAFLDNTGNSSVTDVSAKRQCVVEFDVPAELDRSPVLFYYKLTNFYQNHRRYVKSLNADQLKGKFVSVKDLDNSDCKPLATIDNVPVYPCGLIANSLFNDTFSNPVLLNPSGGDGSPEPYEFTSKGIAWSGEAKKYASEPNPRYNETGIVPPPNWRERYPQGYTADNPPPDLHNDEHFQNWMRTAGLPTFTKLYGRNDTAHMKKGTYRIIIGLNFPVLPYKGTKSFVVSTVSWIGGKNPFLGWAYVAAAAVFVLLAILGTIRHLVKPRRLGDMSLLSWNR
ncbi:putative LEM3 (ligand-effect modulator 3) family / CDC50 family protein [Lyophyllum shimeji]|uniref:LEM3 (Ligand-effect modulator 3) family / CDC50 family protein n=1 Tax=Lyophyllum shimeji TaxID=47721 RepID=A0A9P3PFR6_LYOSH|nr:putative LEM3 (ligand-effect modulator 3) family / CDC50 family protein [Lyophyllum shimeji]